MPLQNSQIFRHTLGTDIPTLWFLDHISGINVQMLCIYYIYIFNIYMFALVSLIISTCNPLHIYLTLR